MPFNFKQIQQKFPDALQLTVTFKRGVNPPTDDQLCSFLGGGKVLYSKDLSGNKKKIVVSKLAAAKFLVIYGPQGSGKTTLALQYAKLLDSDAKYCDYKDSLEIGETCKTAIIDNWPPCVPFTSELLPLTKDWRSLPAQVIICIQTRPDKVLAFMKQYVQEAKMLAIEWLNDSSLSKDSVADLVGEKMGFDWDKVREQQDAYNRYRASVWNHYCYHRRTLLDEIKQAKQNLKRRYNLCSRLRKKGVIVTTDVHAIEITEAEYYNLSTGARRYLDELQTKYHYSVQLIIADTGDPLPTS
jgi:energy-coupling factor transporter ATP-binding protein EcfA2